MSTDFIQLNNGWNAQPNTPNPEISIQGGDLILSFRPNSYQFPKYENIEIISLKFIGCRKYRLGATNDEGWYKGQCRFSDSAPKWGEFYEIKGDLKLEQASGEWDEPEKPGPGGRHFLFYFRDETFECEAADWIKKTGSLA
ncbi:MAG: hypothetical protein MJA83_19485 [Gammaproteobacteria bacterium]|nr:hypothetical protein [Gammaproteobacteria bacterium]